MPRGVSVPISQAALRWALDRSGYSADQFAAELKVDPGLVHEWLTGNSKPNLTQFNKITNKLNRPAPVFFMEQPPSDTLPNVSFRAPVDSERTAPNPKELRFLREANRLQKTTSWILGELDYPDSPLPRIAVNERPEAAATKVRELLLSKDDTSSFPLNIPAWKVWRERLERVGVIVLALPLGHSSSRGFSLWDKRAPLIAVNTAWNNQARLFSIFHEIGHLVTRTQSVCIESSDGRFSKSPDKVERWAERFSASVLMPWQQMHEFLVSKLGINERSQVRDLSIAEKLAREFEVSLRAAVIRLIEHDLATWDLYREIPPASDAKKGGGGGGGRDRRQKRIDEYGRYTMSVFSEAVDSGLLHRSEALSYLNIADTDLDEVRRAF